jgi:hypothetical protein
MEEKRCGGGDEDEETPSGEEKVPLGDDGGGDDDDGEPAVPLRESSESMLNPSCCSCSEDDQASVAGPFQATRGGARGSG